MCFTPTWYVVNRQEVQYKLHEYSQPISLSSSLSAILTHACVYTVNLFGLIENFNVVPYFIILELCLIRLEFQMLNDLHQVADLNFLISFQPQLDQCYLIRLIFSIKTLYDFDFHQIRN